MVDGDLFGLLADLATRLRKKTDRPFGGIQVRPSRSFTHCYSLAHSYTLDKTHGRAARHHGRLLPTAAGDERLQSAVLRVRVTGVEGVHRADRRPPDGLQTERRRYVHRPSLTHSLSLTNVRVGAKASSRSSTSSARASSHPPHTRSSRPSRAPSRASRSPRPHPQPNSLPPSSRTRSPSPSPSQPRPSSPKLHQRPHQAPHRSSSSRPRSTPSAPKSTRRTVRTSPRSQARHTRTQHATRGPLRASSKAACARRRCSS